MDTAPRLGIWMDHAHAYLTEYPKSPTAIPSIASEFKYEDKKNALSKSESLMHNQEQHEQAEYYKKLSEVIRNYGHILLFGPTDAKTELFNILRENYLFETITIDVKTTDKMTDHEQQAFIKEHFS
jgi:stalled ribosome rescue protein Dom34